jgi:hypothetical protein
MKRKSILTIAGLFALTVGLVSCGTTNKSSNTTAANTTSAPVTSAPVTTVAQTFSISNKDALQAEWHAGDADRQVTFAAEPEINPSNLLASGELKITSSDPSIVAVFGTYLRVLKAGTVTISASYNTLLDAVQLTTLESLSAPDFVHAKIADIYASEDSAGKNVYVSTVEVVSFKSGSNGGTYGNLNVKVDDTTKLVVYGATASASALTYSLTTKKYTFKNPQDYMTNADTKAIKVGDKLDVLAIRADYINGTAVTKEISIVVVGINGKAIATKGTNAAPLTTDEIQNVAEDAKDNMSDKMKMLSYFVKGKITKWSGSNTDGTKYGNFSMKSDGAKGSEIVVYGASVTGTLAYDATKKKTVFTNAQDFLTDAGTKDLKIGDEVTMQVVRCDYNGTKEICGIVIPTVVAVPPVISEVKIADLLKKTATDATVVQVSGIVGKVTNATHGNMYLIDPSTGDQITVFGSSAIEADFAKTDTNLGYYTGVFTDKSDFGTACAAGDYITMQVSYINYKGTSEITGWIKTVVAAASSTYTFTASNKTTDTNGTVTLDKTSGLKFGDTVTVTATASSGYKVNAVTVGHGSLISAETLTAGSDGKYTFTANVVNEVTVTFASTSLVKKTMARTNLIGTKAVGDTVSLKDVQVIYNGGSSSPYLVAGNESGYATIYAKGTTATSFDASLIALSVGSVINVTGVVTSFDTTKGVVNTYIGEISAYTASTVSQADYTVAAPTTAEGDFTTTTSANTYVQGLETLGLTDKIVGCVFQTVTNVKLAAVSSNYNYFKALDSTSNYSVAKSNEATKKIQIGLFYYNGSVTIDTTKTYDITFMIYATSKAFTDTANNTIIRLMAAQIVEHTA